jgi:hypothetical protein
LQADDLKLAERIQKRVRIPLDNLSRMMPKLSSKAVLKPFSKAGTVKKLFLIVVSKVFPMNGVRQLMFRPWYSETWVIPQPQV